MSDDFLRAITPGWDELSEDQKQGYRQELRTFLAGPRNPVTPDPSEDDGHPG